MGPEAPMATRAAGKQIQQEKYSTADHINKAPNVTTEAANLAFCARWADNSIRSNP